MPVLVKINKDIDYRARSETRANLHRLRKELAPACADLEKAIALAPPGHASAQLLQDLLDLGKLLDQGGEHQQALQRFDQLVALAPGHGEAHRLRAEILLKLNRHVEAGQALDRHLAVSRQPTAKVCVARALIHLESRQHAAAVDLFTWALRLEPHDVRTRASRGWTFLMMDAAKPALDDFHACLMRDADDTDALIGRGLARVRLKQVAEAVQDSEAAEKTGPRTTRHRYNLACLYAQVAGRLGAVPPSRSSLAGDVYLERSLLHLRAAVELTPADRRAAFWRDVANDPYLVPLRRLPAFEALTAQYRPPNG
jgi:predicted Zn-dependent protease